MAKTKSAVNEVFTLPSKGLLYGEEFPKDVTIRSMTTFEEKMRLGGQGFYKTMCSILDSVCSYEGVEDMESQYLTVFDFYFLMYKMRSVSYGHTYKVKVTCPECGKTQVCNVDLDTLKVDYLKDDFTEPFKIGPLPRSGDTLECRFMRISDLIKNEKKAKEILEKSPNYEGDPSYILDICSKITKINGEDKSSTEVEMYVEKMTGLDSAYFYQAYNKAVEGVGMSTICQDTCSACGTELKFELPFNSEFFRPTFDF